MYTFSSEDDACALTAAPQTMSVAAETTGDPCASCRWYDPSESGHAYQPLRTPLFGRPELGAGRCFTFHQAASKIHNHNGSLNGYTFKELLQMVNKPGRCYQLPEGSECFATYQEGRYPSDNCFSVVTTTWLPPSLPQTPSSLSGDANNSTAMLIGSPSAPGFTMVGAMIAAAFAVLVLAITTWHAAAQHLQRCCRAAFPFGTSNRDTARHPHAKVRHHKLANAVAFEDDGARIEEDIDIWGNSVR